MSMFPGIRSIQHLGRYREIVTILARHGFGSALQAMQLDRRLALPASLFKQPAPAPHSPPEHLRLALEELGPTFIKLGQILSTRSDLLPPDYIIELSKLQDAVPSCPWEEVRDVLSAELGAPPDQVFLDIDPRPLAAASLAQVHAATLPVDAPGGDPARVVVKVQRPRIAGIIQADLEVLEDLASLAQRTPIGELYEPVEMVADFAHTLRGELDYAREGRNAERFAQNFAGETRLRIPRIYWRQSTSRVLVMERIAGIKIDDTAALDAAGYDRHAVAVDAARIMIKEVLEDGFFHADPHPGNFVVMPGGVIGVMDFGMVGRLTAASRMDLARLYVALIQQDAPALVEQLRQLSAPRRPVDRRALERDVARLIDRYAGSPLKSLRMGDVLQDIVGLSFRHRLRVPPDLFLVMKTMVMMEGLGRLLDPDFDAFAVCRPLADRLMRAMWSPGAWGPALLSSADAWMRVMRDLPRTAADLLRGIEGGQLPVDLKVGATRDSLDRLDRLITRLSLSILIAAFVLGLAFVVPSAADNPVLSALAVAGFASVLVLGIWFAVSILRHG